MSADLIARLLDTLDALGVIARHLHPPRLAAVVATLGDRDATLRAALAGAVWPAQPAVLREQVERAVEHTLLACDGLRAAADSTNGPRSAYRALRQVARAHEALYPVASVLPSVSRFFLEPGRQADQALLRPTGCGRAAARRADRRHACRE